MTYVYIKDDLIPFFHFRNKIRYCSVVFFCIYPAEPLIVKLYVLCMEHHILQCKTIKSIQCAVRCRNDTKHMFKLLSVTKLTTARYSKQSTNLHRRGTAV